MPCCGCGDNKVGDEQVEPSRWFFKKRGCTDIICLIFFIAFLGGMGFIVYLSVTAGDPYAVFYGSDYLGNRCGIGKMADKPKVYYPRVDQDLIAQSVIASSMPWKLKFYGLCLEACPNVTTPEACFADPDQCKVSDYGTVAERTAAGGSPYYYATMPSLDVINRCIPNDKFSLDQEPDRCAFPQCDGVNYKPCDTTYPTTWLLQNNFPRSLSCKVKFRVGEIKSLQSTSSNAVSSNLGQKVAGVMAIVDTIVDSWQWILLFGLAMPIVLGFIWLFLLRLFAMTFTYIMIIAIGLFMLALTIYLFALAGAFTDLVALLNANTTVLTVEHNASQEVIDAAIDVARQGAAEAMGVVTSAQEAIVQAAPTQLTDLMTASSAAPPALWWILASISALVTLLYIFSMCAARKNIKIAVAIVKESSAVLQARPLMMFFPFGTMTFQILWLGFFVLIALFLGTASLSSSHFSGVGEAITQASTFLQDIQFYNATIATGGLDKFKSMDNSELYVSIAVYIYFIYGFLVVLETLNNISWTAMSGAVAQWFFFRDEPSGQTRIPLLRSLGRVFRFHLGSMAFGAFIVAFVQLLRLIMYAIDYFTKRQQDKNFLLKLAIKCCQCCLYCLEKTIKFITDYCYIYVALQGSGFCRSCFLVFSLIFSHPAQLSINTFVRTILSWVQLLGLPIACGWVANIALVNLGKPNPIWPTVVVAIAAFVIARIFKTVFACVLDTLFVCCCRDKSEYSGKYMPDRLKTAFGFDKKSKKDKKAEGGDAAELAAP